jgi:hypothetical protein
MKIINMTKWLIVFLIFLVKQEMLQPFCGALTPSDETSNALFVDEPTPAPPNWDQPTKLSSYAALLIFLSTNRICPKAQEQQKFKEYHDVSFLRPRHRHLCMLKFCHKAARGHDSSTHESDSNFVS